MTESHHDGWTVAVNAMQDDNRAIDSRLYIKENKAERVRRASVLHVEKGSQSIGLLALLEDSPAFAHLDRSTQANEDGIAHALQSIALKFLEGRAATLQSTIRQLRKTAE